MTDNMEGAKSNASGWLASIEEMLAALEAGCEAAKNNDERLYEAAEQTIQESVLSVQIRGGWHSPGADEDGADEYEILLSTGGPALRIWGKLDQYCQPSSAELQMQDWGTPWTRFPAAEATILKFASCFYFGE